MSPPAARVRRTRWSDSRLIAGVLLILLSVLLGARVVRAADRSTLVYAARQAFPPGYQLTAADLTSARVRLFGQALADRYIAVGSSSLAGYVVLRDVAAGELLPRASVAPPDGAPAVRHVTVSVERGHALGGEVAVGDRVDILATYGAGGSAPTVTRVVAQAVPVVRRPREGGGFGAGGGGDLTIVVAVPPEQAVALTAALRVARIDVLKVVPGRGSPGRLVPTEVATSPRSSR